MYYNLILFTLRQNGGGGYSDFCHVAQWSLVNSINIPKTFPCDWQYKGQKIQYNSILIETSCIWYISVMEIQGEHVTWLATRTLAQELTKWLVNTGHHNNTEYKSIYNAKLKQAYLTNCPWAKKTTLNYLAIVRFLSTLSSLFYYFSALGHSLLR